MEEAIKAEVKIMKKSCIQPQIFKYTEFFGSYTSKFFKSFLKIGWLISTSLGRHLGGEKTNLNLYKWIEKIQKLGAGEICLTSINFEGKQNFTEDNF